MLPLLLTPGRGTRERSSWNCSKNGRSRSYSAPPAKGSHLSDHQHSWQYTGNAAFLGNIPMKSLPHRSQALLCIALSFLNASLRIILQSGHQVGGGTLILS